MAGELKDDTILDSQQAEGEIMESNRDESSNASGEETKAEMEIEQKKLAIREQRQARIIGMTR